MRSAIFILFLTIAYALNAHALGVYSCSEGLEGLSQIEFNLEDPTYRDFSKDFAAVVMMKSPLLFSERHFQILKEQLPAVTSIKLEDFVSSKGKNLTAQVKQNLSERIWSGLTDKIVSFHEYSMPNEVPQSSRLELRFLATQIGITEKDLLTLSQTVFKINNNPTLKEKVISLISSSLAEVAELGEKVQEIENRKKLFETISQEQRILFPKVVEIDGFKNGKVDVKRTFETGAAVTQEVDLIDLITIAHPILLGQAHMEALDRVAKANGAKAGKLKKSLKGLSPQELQSLAEVTWDQISNSYGLFKGGFGINEDLDEPTLNYFGQTAVSLNMTLDDYLQTRLLIHAIDNNPDVRALIIKVIKETYKESLSLKGPLKVAEKTSDFFGTRNIKNVWGRMGANVGWATLMGALSGVVPLMGDLVYQTNKNTDDGTQFLIAGGIGAALPAVAAMGSKVTNVASNAWHRHSIKKIIAKSKDIVGKPRQDSEEE